MQGYSYFKKAIFSSLLSLWTPTAQNIHYYLTQALRHFFFCHYTLIKKAWQFFLNMQDDHYAIIDKSVFTRALKQIQKNYICNLGQHITIAPNEARLVIPKQSTDHCLPFPHCKYHSSQRCAFEGSIWLASLSIAVFYCRRRVLVEPKVWWQIAVADRFRAHGPKAQMNLSPTPSISTLHH